MNNDNGANDAPHDGERPVVGHLETERQELQRRRLEHELMMRRLELEIARERQQLLLERERLRRNIDNADARNVLISRW